jgi:hypothetical protein
MERHPSFAPLKEVAQEQAARVGENSPAIHARFTLAHADLFREVFGNPFRRVTFDSDLLTGTVESLARAVYEERALPRGELDDVRLAVLADALEETGCSEQGILDHLRSPGPHVRGCWAVDLVLAKE